VIDIESGLSVGLNVQAFAVGSSSAGLAAIGFLLLDRVSIHQNCPLCMITRDHRVPLRGSGSPYFQSEDRESVTELDQKSGRPNE
jgi:hypothetical protein